jgi:hypothetical protein
MAPASAGIRKGGGADPAPCHRRERIVANFRRRLWRDPADRHNRRLPCSHGLFSFAPQRPGQFNLRIRFERFPKVGRWRESGVMSSASGDRLTGIERFGADGDRPQ